MKRAPRPSSANSRSFIVACPGLPNSSMRSWRASAACAASDRAAVRRFRAPPRAHARHLRCLAEFVDQPHAQRRRRIDERAAREQLRGMAADQASERPMDRRPGQQPHLHFVQPEPEIAERHHAIVAVDRHDRAARRTVPGDAEDHGHRGVGDRALRAPQLDEQCVTPSRSSSSMPRTSSPAEKIPGWPVTTSADSFAALRWLPSACAAARSSMH